LLEQQRPNVFTMNVANIMPGDVIKTELLYSELLVPEDGHYDFVYPTVVGPRNPMGSEAGSVEWNANPYLTEGKKEPYKFDIQVQLTSPIELKKVGSPSHAVSVAFQSKQSARIKLAKAGGGNRDYVLRYHLAGDQIESGTMLYDHGGEKFFLMMMEPPKRVTPANIPGREYVFVLDVSGSMNGFPLDTAKEVMTSLFQRMRPNDFFNVVVFAGRAGVLSETSLPATRENLAMALDTFKRMRGGGGTNLMDALRTSYALPRPDAGPMSRSVVVVTDGYVTVEAKAFRFIRKRLGEANLFAFGIGSSVNRALIEGMARAGLGSPFIVLDKTQAPEKAAKLREYIEAPLLTNIKVGVQGLDVYDTVPEALPDLMAARPLIVFGKYRGNGQGTIRVTGAHGGGAFQQSMPLDASAANAGNRPLRALWARHWAEQLMDQYNALGGDDGIKKAVTNLGLSYSLLTQFTSFIAVDSRVANTGGQLDTVKQPLPLPQGVSNLAVPSRRMRVMSADAAALPAAEAFGAGGLGSGSMRSAPKGIAPRPSPRPAPPPSEALRKDEDSRTPVARALKVTKMSNLEASSSPQLERLLRRLLARCIDESGFGGKLLVRLYPNGTIGTEGTSPALTRCLQRHRVIEQLMRALAPQRRLDPGKPATIELNVTRASL
jgi:Ca-activated chloride channel family protein